MRSRTFLLPLVYLIPSIAAAQPPNANPVPVEKQQQVVAEKTVIGTVLGNPVYESDRNPNVSLSDDVLRLFIMPLQEDHQKQHPEARITEEEIAAFAKVQDKRLATQMAGYTKKLSEIELQMKDLDKESDRYQELRQQKRVVDLKIRSVNEAQPVAPFFLQHWKFQKYLYENYGGGRVLLSAFGPGAYDAQKKWLEECEQLGKFQVLDEKLREKIFAPSNEAELGWRLTDDPQQIEDVFSPGWAKQTAPPAKESADAPTLLRLLKGHKEFDPQLWKEHVRELLHSKSEATQVAALEVAEMTGSVYFMPSIQAVIDRSDNESVVAAARCALAACARPLATPLTTNDSWPSLDFPAERAAQLIARIKKKTDVPSAVAELQKITGLDFGNGVDQGSRNSWLEWWYREQATIDNAVDGKREFLVHGMVTDPHGQPLRGATVKAEVPYSPSPSGIAQAAYSLSDNDGRYLLRIGFFQNVDGLPITKASFCASLPISHAVRSDDQPTDRILSRLLLEDDPIADVKQAEAIYAGRPVEMNFTLYPTARLRVAVVDSEGKPLSPEKLSVRYISKNDGGLIEQPLRPVSNQRYFTSLLPQQSVVIRLQQTKTSALCDTVALPLLNPGEHHVRLTYSAEAKQGEVLSLTVLKSPVATTENSEQ